MSPVYKVSASSIKGRTNYGSMLAGNTAYKLPGDYESIQTVTVASTAANAEFTSIPSTYKNLQIRAITRTDRSDPTNALDQLYIRFNDDTGTNYTRHFLSGDGATASSFGEGSISAGLMIYSVTNNATAGIFAPLVLDILDYKDTNKFKTVRGLLGVEKNGSGNMTLHSSLWRSTSAVTSIKIYALGNFVQYSHFSLYGIKG